ncbi:hypothetical protein SERLA73DRAFT_96138 [Serpula lacrymans var. lacrymans S7.3]|uniref:NAD(P)-binding protein n=1 Tax=Serpula lacrymans var. lacrymans (strain S7.3) TaxID=936435 RepID=F8QAJ1_SERL3|nr:hypothetical protein SERLA73DRAFT_96138 [Serpula lacrymans var. lacrymans S7.3]
MGIYWSTLVAQSFPPAPTFSVDEIPDLTGKVVLVTGANVGIGKETARTLLTKNAKVYLGSRDKKKGEGAINELKELTGREAHLFQINLASLKDIKASVEEFLKSENQLHVLINNAGVMNAPVNLLTEDGYDLQFGTNVLGHFYLTKLLLPLMESTVKISPKGTVRVVNVCSMAHIVSNLHFNTFKDSRARRRMPSMKLYGQSKTGNIVFSTELHRRYQEKGIITISVHPGLIKSELHRHNSKIFDAFLALFLYDVPYGALTQLYAGTTPDAEALKGKYLIPWARIGKPRANTQDPQLGRKLWEWLEGQVQDL